MNKNFTSVSEKFTTKERDATAEEIAEIKVYEKEHFGLLPENVRKANDNYFIKEYLSDEEIMIILAVKSFNDMRFIKGWVVFCILCIIVSIIGGFVISCVASL